MVGAWRIAAGGMEDWLWGQSSTWSIGAGAWRIDGGGMEY